jgi:hypothetical protein
VHLPGKTTCNVFAKTQTREEQQSVVDCAFAVRFLQVAQVLDGLLPLLLACNNEVWIKSQSPAEAIQILVERQASLPLLLCEAVSQIVVTGKPR